MDNTPKIEKHLKELIIASQDNRQRRIFYFLTKCYKNPRITATTTTKITWCLTYMHFTVLRHLVQQGWQLKPSKASPPVTTPGQLKPVPVAQKYEHSVPSVLFLYFSSVYRDIIKCSAALLILSLSFVNYKVLIITCTWKQNVTILFAKWWGSHFRFDHMVMENVYLTEVSPCKLFSIRKPRT